MNTFSLDIPASVIRAGLLAAAKKDSRFYLVGLCIDTTTTSPTVVGTDGNVLLAVRLPEATGLPAGRYIVPRAALEMIPKKADTVTVAITPDVVGAASGGFTLAWQGRGCPTASTTGALVDGRYPDWPRVLPTAPDGAAAQMDPAVLGKIFDAFALLGDRLPCTLWNGERAALIVSGVVDNAVGVVMPLRATAISRPTTLDPRAILGVS